jgi:antitoxin FitA
MVGLMQSRMISCSVPKTIQIRDVADDVYSALSVRAAEAGVTVPELLRREAARLASRPTMREWLERTKRGPKSDITTDEIVAALDEIRGPWPDARS